jgi:hypothetical protein
MAGALSSMLIEWSHPASAGHRTEALVLRLREAYAARGHRHEQVIVLTSSAPARPSATQWIWTEVMVSQLPNGT